MSGLLSAMDCERLLALSVDDTLIINPRFYTGMLKGHAEYSFPFYLQGVETLRSTSELLYQTYKKELGEEFAEGKWKKDYPRIDFIILKRVKGTKGRDVVRFKVYPNAIKKLIDHSCFEVDYSTYRNLFAPDKKKDYK